MALLMEPGAEPVSEEEKADLAGLEAIREESAVELKEEGNKFLKRGREHYAKAIDCYTRAIEQKSGDALLNSVLYGNRAQANLLLENYRRVVNDADDAIKLHPNVKAYYRGACGALALQLWSEADRFFAGGLEQDPKNKELLKLRAQIEHKRAEDVEKKRRASEVKSRVEVLVAAISKRSIRIGNALYKERAGNGRPYLDSSGILHWPVLLLYGEVMFSDLIQDFPETDMFMPHIELMFAKDGPPLDWDKTNEYTSDRVELYYQANTGPVLPRRQLLLSLMEGEVGYDTLDLDTEEEDDAGNSRFSDMNDHKWVRIDNKMTLHDALSRSDHIVPGIPVFYVVASGTNFRKKFLSGNWSAP